MQEEHLCNLSLGLAMILSFIVVSVFVSYFATMHSSHTAANAEERNELSVKKVIYGNPLLNGS